MSDTITLFSADELAAMAEQERAATRAPWHAGHLSNPESSCNCVYILDEGHMGGVAEVYVDNGKDISDGGNDAPSVEQAKANQILIAEARNEYARLLAVAQWANELAKAAAQLAEDCEQRDWVQADPEWLSAVEAVNNLLARLAPPVNS